jgi:ABC-type hemin transport system substrate-binding protein
VRSAENVSDAERQEAVASWSALGSLPAVKNRRVIVLGGQGLVVPGPRIADSAEALARALHRQ